MEITKRGLIFDRKNNILFLKIKESFFLRRKIPTMSDDEDYYDEDVYQDSSDEDIEEDYDVGSERPNYVSPDSPLGKELLKTKIEAVIDGKFIVLENPVGGKDIMGGDFTDDEPVKISGMEMGDDGITTENYISKGIFPPPITRKIEAVERPEEIDVPGEIKVSKSGKLLIKYLSYKNFLADIIASYDHAITKGISESTHGRQINLPNGNAIRFIQVYFDRPRMDDTPLKAREQNLTYQAGVSLEIAEFDPNGEIVMRDDRPNIRKIGIGNIPIMLGSVLDPLRAKSEAERISYGECVSDPQGYFIIEGNEYIILMRDQLRSDRILTTVSAKHGMKCNMTCRTKIGGTVALNLFENTEKTGVSKTVMISLPFLSTKKINVFIIYYMLGIENPDHMIDMILSHVKFSNQKKVRARLHATKLDFYGVYGNGTKVGQGAVNVIAATETKTREAQMKFPEYRDKYVIKIKEELFPQIPEDQVENKLIFLSLMISRFVENAIGLRELDNRDSWSNKRIMTAGVRITQLFGQCIRKTISSLTNPSPNKKGTIFKCFSGQEVKRGSHNYFDEIVQKFETMNIHEEFRSSFTTKWGCRGNDKRDENVTEPLAKLSILDRYAHSTQIKAKSNTKTKSTKIREVEMSQTGYIDPIYSSEGANCGIVKAKAVTCWISIDRDGSDILSFLGEEHNSHLISSRKTGIHNNVCIMNGRLLGWCDPQQLRDILIRRRRSRMIFEDTAIVVDSDGVLWIDTRDQRPTRPLLIVNQETGNLVIDEKRMWGSDFEDLLNNGAVEYIDAWEQEYCWLAQHIDDISRRQEEIDEIVNEISDLRSRISEKTGETGQEIVLLDDTKSTSSGRVDRAKYERERIREDIETEKEFLVTLQEEYKEIESNTDGIVESRRSRLEKEKSSLGDKLEEFRQDQPSNVDEINDIMLRLDEIDVEIDLLDDPESLEVKRLIRETQDQCYMQIMQKEEEIKNLVGKLASINTGSSTKTESVGLGLFDRDESFIDDVDNLQIQLAKMLRILDRYHQKGPFSRYTHCELDPNALMGVAASVIPLPDHNQAPRNTYQCNMGRQSLGIYNSAHMYRFDTTAKLLAYPSRPMFETQMYKVLGLHNLPAGQNVVLAISNYYGYNQEDALIFKKSSIDRGLFMMTVFHSVDATFLIGSERLGNLPDPIRRTRNEKIYHAIDTSNGIARIKSIIKKGDCLVSKYTSISSEGKTEYIDQSVYAKIDQIGTVDSIVKTSHGGTMIIKIKLRQERIPELGDKFASRHAQKSTIGLIVKDEDMPFTREGIKPDLIMNPHAIPSRMTLGQIIEIVTSKHAALTGERINATAFNNFDVGTFKKSLHQLGYQRGGKETLYSGITGKPIKTQIFIGPCYYQALKHHVQDKIQSRSTGSIDPITRGPVGGRSLEGGMRLGEMEKDAFISHGAGTLLNERLCLSSDAYKAVYCKTCGNMATSGYQKEYSCRLCENPSFGSCTIPYPLRVLSHLMGGANMKIQFNFDTSQ